MRYFLDTEFNGFCGPLIALALVPEEPGAAPFYQAVPCERPTAWIAEHVLPVLGTEPVPRAELGALLQGVGRLAHGVELGQAEGEPGGDFLGRRLLGLHLLGLGQQQARLQVGEPGGHHEVVGGQREAHPPGLLHEGQVLLGELQDRELEQVHLLAAGQGQQDVQRALVALDVDDQGLPVLGRGGRGGEVEVGLETAAHA